MLTGINPLAAKRHNIEVVRETIRLFAPLSRTDVARRVGLTKQTISNLVGELVEDGIVLETSRTSGSRGAPAIQLQINPDAAYAVGLDLDTDHLTAVLVDLSGAVRARYEVGLGSPEAVVELCAKATQTLAAELNLEANQILGVGVGVPGPLRSGPNGARLVSSVGRQDWSDVPLTERLRERLELPVFIENNAVAAAVGEHWCGAGRHLSTFFYAYLGSGLTGGLMAQGAPFRGHTGNAGRIMDLTSRADVGADGEARVGEAFNLASLYARLADSGVTAARPADLLLPYQMRNTAFEAWFAEATEQLVSLLRAVRAVFDPEAMFIGGRWPDPLLNELVDVARLRVTNAASPGAPDRPYIRLGGAGTNAAAVGAASLPLYDAFVPRQRGGPRHPGATAEG